MEGAARCLLDYLVTINQILIMLDLLSILAPFTFYSILIICYAYKTR